MSSGGGVRIVKGPGEPFAAGIEVPGDKSLSHRALILSAMASGTSSVARLATGRDVAATLRIVEQLGVAIDGDRLVSPGIDGWRAPEAIDVVFSVLGIAQDVRRCRQFKTSFFSDCVIESGGQAG